jgi:hypothetical protein
MQTPGNDSRGGPDNAGSGEGGPRRLAVQLGQPLGVCECGDLEAEHRINDAGQRKACSVWNAVRGPCPCRLYVLTSLLWPASAYVMLPASMPAPKAHLVIE